MSMKNLWKSIVGSIGAVVLVKVIGYFYGTKTSIITLGILMLVWLVLHLFYKRQLKNIKSMIDNMNENDKTRFKSNIPQYMHTDLEKMKTTKTKA